MISLKLPLSRAVSRASLGKDDWEDLELPDSRPPSPPKSLMSSSASSVMSAESSSGAEQEDVTINVKKSLEGNLGKQHSIDDLRLLAISTSMTELSYSISDIQTRIFEIQELRHQSQASQNSQGSSTAIIDQALMNLDERIDTVNRGMKSVADALEPLSQHTPKQPTDVDEEDERALILRKHAALVADWEAVQSESDVLREELKEDKWLTVFRTVSEQADGMMTSLEKAVQRCQDFIWRVHKRGHSEDSPYFNATISSSSQDSAKAPLTYDTYQRLQESFEAKKKHYMPATSKVLSIIDKGVQDRVTKNGECLRRHAESSQRWKNLKERIQRTDSDMETVRKILSMQDYHIGEDGSVRSGYTSNSKASFSQNGHLATPPPSEGHRRGSGSRLDALANSISPFRKLAKRISKASGRSTPTRKEPVVKAPASDPVPSLRNRQSMFALRGITNQLTPDRPTHKHSQSATPESPLVRKSADPDETVKGRKPMWNSSTKIEEEPRRPAMSRRSSAANMRAMANGSIPPVPPLPPRSQSRSSFTSSRPWSPITASQTPSRSSYSRPPSRAQSPHGYGTNPRARPKTPSQIPTPKFWKGGSNSSETSYDDRSPPSSSIMQRLSPSRSEFSSGGFSVSGAKTPLGQAPFVRPPSRSMIPVPKFQISSASRPGTAMSDYDRPETSMSFRSGATSFRAQTPESTLRGRVRQLPYFQDDFGSASPAGGATITAKRMPRQPPSSFRDASVAPSQAYSRPPSRSGAATPSMYGDDESVRALHAYVAANPRDPLDAEVAAVSNAIPHGLLIERVDPPMPRNAPPYRDGEEVKAQYAFSNHLARKVVNCRLMTTTRGEGKSRKVMCRVGGGWQELSLYLLSRQAGA